jgi:hypothetical protein
MSTPRIYTVESEMYDGVKNKTKAWPDRLRMVSESSDEKERDLLSKRFCKALQLPKSGIDERSIVKNGQEVGEYTMCFIREQHVKRSTLSVQRKHSNKSPSPQFP